MSGNPLHSTGRRPRVVLSGWLVDYAIARLRPGWIRDRLPLLLSRYERFAPQEWISLPPGSRMTVVAPHPDDESIGAGGLIAAWTGRPGQSVEVVFLTQGEAGDRLLRSGDLTPDERETRFAEVIRKRRGEAGRALDILGASAHWLDGRDGALATEVPRLSDALKARFEVAPPDIVVTPFPADRHADHAAAARIVGRAMTALPDRSPILCYEVWSPAPVNALFDISDTADAKWRAITSHESQITTTDYVAAAKGLATYRGISGGRNVLAEAFVRTTAAEYRAMAESLRIGP